MTGIEHLHCSMALPVPAPHDGVPLACQTARIRGIAKRRLGPPLPQPLYGPKCELPCVNFLGGLCGEAPTEAAPARTGSDVTIPGSALTSETTKNLRPVANIRPATHTVVAAKQEAERIA